MWCCVFYPHSPPTRDKRQPHKSADGATIPAMEHALDFLLSLPAHPHAAAAVLCGFVIGWLICFTGVGGGVLVVPALTFFFALPPALAIGTASAYAALTKLLAGAEHARIGNINYVLLFKLISWALPGLAASAAAIHYFLAAHPQQEPLVQETLRAAVIAAIVLSLILTLRRPPPATESTAPPPPAALAAAGIGIGIVMGATGIGGGVLIAPALLILGKDSPKRVVGTSIAAALGLSALTALLYSAGGQADIKLALCMSAGSLAAIPAASRTLRRASENTVKKSIIVLIAVAILLTAAG